MKKILLCLLFLSTSVLAQKVHLPHEVEKAAEPAGGMLFLNQFISSNLQIPFESAVKGINQKVFIKGIVEPDGYMSQIEVTKGIDSLCNAEAVRVMNLFKAWKPATIGGQKVRQAVYYPISFVAPAKAGFDSTKSELVDYFDEKFEPTSDPAKYEYRRIIPLDNRGFVKANVVYEQLEGKKWRMLGEAGFVKKQIRYKVPFSTVKGDSMVAYSISARDANLASHAPEAIFQTNGQLLSYSEFGLNNKISLNKEFDLNGMVRAQQLYTDTLITDVTWYENGQMKDHKVSPVMQPGGRGEPLLLNLWTADGKQWVKDGHGYWRAKSEAPGGETIYEGGQVAEGVKNGKWVGKLADSTLYYEEVYNLGVMETGYSMINGQKKEYSTPMISPAFKGGQTEMYKFLAMNIKYPINAARRGVSGRILLSFVVCEDGSVCDYKVESGAGFGLDDEALRVVKLMNGRWEPGVQRGQKVRVKYNLPVNFQLAGGR